MQFWSNHSLFFRFRDKYGGDYDRFLSSLLVTCEDVIVECKLGFGIPLSGDKCCGQFIDKSPHLTAHGTCFGTTSGIKKYLYKMELVSII